MKTAETPPDLEDAQALADLEEVCRLISEGKKVTDPDASSSGSRGRSDKAREETLRLFGVQDIGVNIIRAMRDPKV